MTTPAQQPGPVDTVTCTEPTRRSWAAWLVVACLVPVAVVAGVLVPYLLNGLHHLPLAEVASGAHDPKDLWPFTAGSAGALLRLTGGLGITIGPAVLLVTATVAGTAVHAARRAGDRAGMVPPAVVLAVSLVTMVVLMSPFGWALRTWMLD